MGKRVADKIVSFGEIGATTIKDINIILIFP